MTHSHLFDALQDWEDTIYQKASQKSSGLNIFSGQQRPTSPTPPKSFQSGHMIKFWHNDIVFKKPMEMLLKILHKAIRKTKSWLCDRR